MTKDQATIHVLMKENDELKLEIGRLRNNSIIIPENATNGDMIKTMFPNSETYFHEKYGLRDDHYSTIIGEDEVNCNICCDVDWWNALYKGGKNHESD